MEAEWRNHGSGSGFSEEVEESYRYAPTFEELMAARKLTVEDLKEHISGPVLSVIVHVVILAILSTVIVFRPPDEGTEIEVKEIIVKVKPLEKKIEPPKPEDPKPEDTDMDVERPADVTESDVVAPEEEIVTDSVVQDVTVPNILNVCPSDSSLRMPALYGGRTTGGRRDGLVAHGGSRHTERGVIKGLLWLKDHQNSDGSWGEARPDDHPALTGLALLAFLAHGETPSSAEFGQTVLKGIKKLIEFLGPDASGVIGGYRHGIVMYALSEAYTLTKIPMLEDVMNKGMTKLIQGMNGAGAFNYGYGVEGLGPGHGGKTRDDLSVSGWNYQALKAAFSAGCSSEGLEAALDKGISVGLQKTFFGPQTGSFCYAVDNGKQQNLGSPTMTAAGVLCLQLMGAGKCSQARDGVKYLEQPKYATFDFNNPSDINWSFYNWYYETQVFFQAYGGKGGKWRAWNKMFSRELLRHQKTDGRWETPGSMERENLPGLNMPIYSTALGCLMLEVYYRYLPTFQVAEERHLASAKNGEGMDDLGLE